MTEAVVFDVMGTMFDLSPLRTRLTRAGAPEGAMEAWFGRMLHVAAMLTLVGEFRPFREVASSTLDSVLAQLGADVDGRDRCCRVSASSNREQAEHAPGVPELPRLRDLAYDDAPSSAVIAQRRCARPRSTPSSRKR